MQDQNKQQSQSRFFLAAVLSMMVLTGWMYFFAPEKPEQESANANTNASQQANVNIETKPAPEVKKEDSENAVNTAESETSADENPNKTVTIKTPLYEVKLNSKGAVATSWILKVNDTDDPKARKNLYADGSNKQSEKPLELVSQEGLKEEPRLAPFQLSTGDEKLDKTINYNNYKVSADSDEIEIKGNESKQIDFTYEGENGVQVTKTFVFRADNYIADLSVKLTKDGKPVPNTKLLIGPSIGDQGVNRYTFYTVEPEGVYNAEGSASRQYAASITEENGKGEVKVPGEVDWAGIGDTYFAMAAIPAKKTPGLEFRSSKFEQETKPYYDGIISWITRNESTKTVKHLMTAYVPITADGSTNKIYTGTKDYFVLHNYNDRISQAVGRTIDIEEFINYGYMSFFTRPLSAPILYVLKFLYNFVNNYGIAIIIFTFLFYSLLFPFRWYSSKSFKKAQKNAPMLKEVQERQKEMQKQGVPADDPKMRELQMEQLRMMKGAVPIGGCLPMILQFPLLIALYITVSIYLGFRQETFLWLPDLSAGDPYHILEFAFAISMILSFKFSPITPAAAASPEQKMQQNMMTYIMPIMMLWIMWSAPSGLLLYWFTGNIIMFGQQLIINYLNKTDEPPEEEKEKTEILRKKPKLSTS
ncbi:MAG: membrane protein insertase YidC [Acidobacteriota bacterium]|jgi:YidC/Oxa1 family membrane protein insertase|nr:membrane protein insertase YidC [Acidobacteriota bacterium]